ncbi:hypothetical protein SAMN05421847_2118 [Halpernia humi]|uniref:Uncharacterized protein n=1 Tax=Halpernia humi TaxID=493375 RepID=A0A1H5ZN26_9FLAO|nr:hypothetical protein [Halpernia humi]SEG37918.1 hypothetical protein SAMN05421847_2118 [Halpernia humi]
MKKIYSTLVFINLCLLMSFAQKTNVSNNGLKETVNLINKKIACCSKNMTSKISVSDQGILKQIGGSNLKIDLRKKIKSDTNPKSLVGFYSWDYIKQSPTDYQIICISKQNENGKKVLAFSAFKNETDAKEILKWLNELKNSDAFIATMQGGFEDTGDNSLFDYIADQANKKKKNKDIEDLLNAELEKQIASDKKKERSVAQKFKIDENGILSFAIKELYPNNCYPSNSDCKVKGIYSIQKQEVALKNLKSIGKDYSVHFYTFGEDDVTSTTTDFSNDGTLLEKSEPYLSSEFATFISLNDNKAFGKKLVELLKDAGYKIEMLAWYPN